MDSLSRNMKSLVQEKPRVCTQLKKLAHHIQNAKAPLLLCRLQLLVEEEPRLNSSLDHRISKH